MENGDHGRWIFPLASLQIGDLQSYLSHLSIFLASESRKIYILVDNRPWLEGLVSRPAHLWQLMVTKSRLSPFANGRSQKGKKRKEKSEPENCTESNEKISKSTDKWFSLLNSATLYESRALLPMKKLKYSLQFNDELHQTLFGLIIFEASWDNVRGINYLNELQTDTSMAVETKYMRRWEFDSALHAAGCMSSWFSGSINEQNKLREYLLSTIADAFCDVTSRNDDEGESVYGYADNFKVYPANVDSNSFHTPPLNVPYKRRKLIRHIADEAEFDLSVGDLNSFENSIEASDYKDVLILFRFNDAHLPFKFRDIIMSDLRLLTLLEAGLPSWVIFLQSYPLFCHIYRPWMCPLVRALYVIISIITVVIGFYDLYKNVPLLKATASRLLGPFFDWIETWEMVSRIKYLGTMLFLHQCQKAIKWIMMTTNMIRSSFSVLAQPLFGPLHELSQILLPVWNMAFQAAESVFSVVWIIVSSSWNLVRDVLEIILLPIWLVLSTFWSTATMVLLPIFWMVKEILCTPIRLVVGLANLLALFSTIVYEVLLDIWAFTSGVFAVASVTEATMNTYNKPSIWHSLWNDLFSQVFRAVRSILNGFAAFFIACNRHRLSIYNHLKKFISALSGQPCQFHESMAYHGGHTYKLHNRGERRRKHHNS
ncbi:hypothetical protein V2J09_015770 [Rumex salicifolius]